MHKNIMLRTAAIAVAMQMCQVHAAEPQPVDTSAVNAPEKDKIQEVVVTAQRQSERLQDVPISIGLLQGSELDQSGIRSVSDALDAVGGVSVIEGSPGNNSIAIRGSVPQAGASTIGYYLDEAPFSFITFSRLPDVSGFDLERVEVLRGPQGTLYGANALNGVVRVLTKDANPNDYELKIRSSASNTEKRGGQNYNGDLAVNVPLVPGKLAIRGVASYSELSGFIDSTKGTGAKEINGSEIQSYRMKVNAQPTENLTAELGVLVSRIDNDAPSLALDNLTTPFGTDRRDSSEYESYSFELGYDFGPFSAISATSYIDFRSDSRGEFLFGTISAFLDNDIPLEMLSQELRLTSNLDGPWRWSAGGFYRDAEQTWDQLPTFNGVQLAKFRNDDESKSFAVFGELSRGFMADKLTLTAGLRYFEDEVTTVDLSDGTRLPNQVSSFDAITWRAVLDYKLDEDLNVYGSVATGFRSGFNQTSLAASAINNAGLDIGPPKEDENITFEIGGKGQFGGLLAYDFAVYYSEWKNLQQGLAVGPAGVAVRVNSKTASGFGVDAGISSEPMDGLHLRASFGWNGLEFDENVTSANVPLFRAGERLNGSAEYTGALSAGYEYPLGGRELRGFFNTDATYSSIRTNRFLILGVATPSDSDHIVEAGLDAGVKNDRWSAALFVDNLFDESGKINGTIGPLSLGTAERLRPRTIGLRLTFEY